MVGQQMDQLSISEGPSLASMPQDVYGFIYRFLDHKEDKRSFTLTCKAIHDAPSVTQPTYEDEKECCKLQAEVQAVQEECNRDLMEAEPVLHMALTALLTLTKNDLTELKSLRSPAVVPVVSVVSACMVLCAPDGKIPKDLSWKACQKFLGPNCYKTMLDLPRLNIPQGNLAFVEENYLSNPRFTPDIVGRTSRAAAGLAAWVDATCRCVRIEKVVEPKLVAFREASKKLEGANKKLAGIRARVKEQQDKNLKCDQESG